MCYHVINILILENLNEFFSNLKSKIAFQNRQQTHAFNFYQSTQYIK